MRAIRGLGHRRSRPITRMKLSANPFKLNVLSVVRNNYIKRKHKRRTKKSKGTGAGGNIANSSNSTSGFHDDSAIVCEILSRLPVKSLVRFKCVCKRWKLLIEEDSYFIDLHLNNSKKHPKLFLIVPIQHKNPGPWLNRPTTPPRICYYKVNLVTLEIMHEGREVVTTSVGTIKKVKFSSENTAIFGPVNGLIGYGSRKQSAIRICNISTQEVSPWIESDFSRNYEGRVIDRTHYYEMGFDPAAKKHKVICIWKIMIFDFETLRYDYMCEVLTVGDFKWRRIELPPYKLDNEYSKRRHTIRLNGFIYFCTKDLLKLGKQGNDKIVAFDVGAENFRVITVPNFIFNQPRHVYPSNRLVELESRLGLLTRMKDNTAKLWIFDDVHGNSKKMNSSTSSIINQNWTEVTIELPYLWSDNRDVSFHSVVGTDQIVIESRQNYSTFAHHLYNWKTKSCRKMDICGFKYSSISTVSTLTESLLHVR